MNTMQIPLGGKYGLKKSALIDAEDIHKVTSLSWHVSDNGYVINRSRGNTVRMHRLIMNTPPGMDTDHINHNKLDNRKSNLRICTRSENLKNKQGVKGYYYCKKRDRWVVDCIAIEVKWKQFKSEEEAKRFVAERREQI